MAAKFCRFAQRHPPSRRFDTRGLFCYIVITSYREKRGVIHHEIDGNELAILQDRLDREGKKKEAWEIKQEFLRQVREAGDHCPLPRGLPAPRQLL